MTELATPSNLEEALAALATERAWTVLAGGTSVYRGDRRALAGTDVLSIHGLRPELRFISVQGDRVRIGALATLRDVARSTVLRDRAPTLVAALAASGDLAYQNRATIGGHFASARALPLLDAWRTLSPLLVLRRPGGARRIACESAFTAEGTFARRADELLVAVQGTLPPRPEESAP